MNATKVVISHSEVESYLLCEQRHFYAFASGGYEPKTFSDSLYRGIVSHRALETYYKAIQANDTILSAAEQGLDIIRQAGAEPNAKFEILTHLATVTLPKYFLEVAPAWDRGYKVMAVEQTYKLDIPVEDDTTIVFAFTPDLILQDALGRNWVVDHKNLYDFMTMDTIDLQPQLPKYIGALRALGMPVHGGLYNTLRTRKIKSDAIEDNFKRQEFIPSNERIKNAIKQQVMLMQRIGKFKAGPVGEWRDSVTRVQNKMICNSCSFKAPCVTEINGGDISLMMQVDFQKNSYGYREDDN